MKILTFDIEEWFHINNSDWIGIEEWPDLEKRVESSTNIILSFLKRHNIKASFFVLGWIAEQYPELVKKIAEAGHDLGYHSYYHRIPKFQGKQEFEEDLVSGIRLLESITGNNIEYYRAPNFSLKNKWIIDCLTDNGIKLSSSIKIPLKHKGVFLPDKPFIFKKGNHNIIELPLLTKNLFFSKFAYSGSGYFRILPYWLHKQLYKNREYLMIYFHPNDFDVNVPTPKELGFVRNTLNTVGTSTTLSKLEKLAKHHSFISISQAMEQIDLENLQRIEY